MVACQDDGGGSGGRDVGERSSSATDGGADRADRAADGQGDARGSRPDGAGASEGDVGAETGDGERGDTSGGRGERQTAGLRTPPEYLAKCEPAELEARQRAALETPVCLGEGPSLFRDVSAQTGVAVRHEFPDYAVASGEYGYDIGGGAIIEDFTGDGWLDIYVTGGSGANRLFYNEGDGSFVDCTDYAGVGLEGDWTNGVSAADMDGDGDQDIYVANSGPDRLLENRADGTFRDVTAEALIEEPGRSSGASWGDVDGDRDLDLYVASLLEEGAMPSRRRPQDGQPPLDPVPSSLYLNRGDGVFEESSATLKAGTKLERASFISPLVDLNGDGRVDLVGFHEFSDSILWANVTMGAEGAAGPRWRLRADAGVEVADAPMGVAVLDIDGNGLMDLATSSLWGNGPSREVFLENRGNFRFEDTAGERQAFAMIPGRHTRVVRAASWGVASLDVENDGDEDLYFAYGRLDDVRSRRFRPFSVAGQPNALLLNDGAGRFALAEGACVEEHGQSRGVARGDVDADGCVDLLVQNQEGSSRLFRNRCADSGAYVELRLRGTRSARDAIGAQVTVTAAGRSQTKQVVAGSRGVHSSSPKRLHFGLGEAERVERVEIAWPSGQTQVLRDLIPGALLRITEPLE